MSFADAARKIANKIKVVNTDIKEKYRDPHDKLTNQLNKNTRALFLSRIIEEHQKQLENEQVKDTPVPIFEKGGKVSKYARGGTPTKQPPQWLMDLINSADEGDLGIEGEEEIDNRTQGQILFDDYTGKISDTFSNFEGNIQDLRGRNEQNREDQLSTGKAFTGRSKGRNFASLIGGNVANALQVDNRPALRKSKKYIDNITARVPNAVQDQLVTNTLGTASAFANKLGRAGRGAFGRLYSRALGSVNDIRVKQIDDNIKQERLKGKLHQDIDQFNEKSAFNREGEIIDEGKRRLAGAGKEFKRFLTNEDRIDRSEVEFGMKADKDFNENDMKLFQEENKLGLKKLGHEFGAAQLGLKQDMFNKAMDDRKADSIKNTVSLDIDEFDIGLAPTELADPTLASIKPLPDDGSKRRRENAPPDDDNSIENAPDAYTSGKEIQVKGSSGETMKYKVKSDGVLSSDSDNYEYKKKGGKWLFKKKGNDKWSEANEDQTKAIKNRFE
jgi:hypothetical protein